MQRIQSLAARRITGAFKATSTPALDIEAHILPVKQQLEKLTSEAVLRIVTSPSYHDIIKPRMERWKSKRKPRKNRLTSPLERHTNRFESLYGNVQQLEKLQPFSVSPEWEPPKTIICKTKEAARKLSEQSMKEGHTMFYTDGSGINKKIGAAAVSYTMGSPWQIFMGSDTWYTVYSAELHGIIQALTIATLKRPHPTGTVIINTDNQSSIRAIGDPGKRSGQIYVMHAVQMINALRDQGISTELHWIPAHIGIAGNEWADVEAKKATGWRTKTVHGRVLGRDTNETAPLSTIQCRMIATVKTAIRKHAYQQWAKEWARETRGNALRKIQPIPSNKTMRLHARVKRAKTSLITQIRTEKIGLRAFLFDRRVPDTDNDKCECGRARQTARHLLHECRLYAKQRSRLWAAERRKVQGGVITHEDMLTTPRYASMAANFIWNTGLIGQFRALDEEQEEGFVEA